MKYDRNLDRNCYGIRVDMSVEIRNGIDIWKLGLVGKHINHNDNLVGFLHVMGTGPLHLLNRALLIIFNINIFGHGRWNLLILKAVICLSIIII